MQRFRLDALQERAGRLYLQGQPFTGAETHVDEEESDAHQKPQHRHHLVRARRGHPEDRELDLVEQDRKRREVLDRRV